MSRVDLSEPSGVDQPARCACGHYVYRHGVNRCNLPAHPDHTRWGRVHFGLVIMRFRCPCRRSRMAD